MVYVRSILGELDKQFQKVLNIVIGIELNPIGQQNREDDETDDYFERDGKESERKDDYTKIDPAGEIEKDPVKFYFRSLEGNSNLLSKKEEQKLAKTIAESRDRYRELASSSPFISRILENIHEYVDESDIDWYHYRPGQIRKKFRLTTRQASKAIDESGAEMFKHGCYDRKAIDQYMKEHDIEADSSYQDELDVPMSSLQKFVGHLKAAYDENVSLQKKARENGNVERLNSLLSDIGEPLESVEGRLKALDSEWKSYRQASDSLARGNTRLVISIAKKYRNRGLDFIDLIGYGNTGLMKAVERFDYRKNIKFSTYGTWWIRQAIGRNISDTKSTVRLPIKKQETLREIRQAINKLKEQGHTATPSTIASKTGIEIGDVLALFPHIYCTGSINREIGDGETEFGDFIENARAEDPTGSTDDESMKIRLQEVLSTLSKRERGVLEQRYGLNGFGPETLKKLGKRYRISRERIRQIEAKAIEKLQHPSRIKKLRDLIEEK